MNEDCDTTLWMTYDSNITANIVLIQEVESGVRGRHSLKLTNS